MKKTIDLQAVKTRFGIIGNSSLLNHALEVAIQVAPTDLSVLIVGESGVGKEIFSEVIHKSSSRKHEPFIAINCGSIPEGTIDSELFGHEKGSFTGADKEREGYFEKVNNGTIFLDEIGETPLGTQARLLRILETGEYIRVGSSAIRKTNVRVVAATNKELYSEIEEGKFRKDLFYRLNTIPIYVPSLKERKEDIPLLFKKFCIDFAAKYTASPIMLDEDAVRLLQEYSWDGNVRQLKNVAEQISVLEQNRLVTEKVLKTYLLNPAHQLAVISEEKKVASGMELQMLYKLFLDLKSEVQTIKQRIMNSGAASFATMDAHEDGVAPLVLSNRVLNTSHGSSEKNEIPTALPSIAHPSSQSLIAHHKEMENLNIAEMERDFILKALEKNMGRKRSAAMDLGISERTLYRKIKDYNIHV